MADKISWMFFGPFMILILCFLSLGISTLVLNIKTGVEKLVSVIKNFKPKLNQQKQHEFWYFDISYVGRLLAFNPTTEGRHVLVILSQLV